MVTSSATFDACPPSEAGYAASCAYLRSEFANWAQPSEAGVDFECFEQLLHYKWAYSDAHLTRWTRADLDTMYLELFPAKVITDEPEDSISEGSMFLDFLEQAGLLDPGSDDPSALRAHLESIRADFLRRMADESLFSPGKLIWSAAIDEGVSIEDREAVAAFVQRFNARPFDQRQDIMGSGPLRSRVHTGRFTPPGTPPRPRRARSRRRR